MPSLVVIGQLFLEKIDIFCKCILAILLLSPLGKRHGPSFKQTWIPFIQGKVVPSLVEIGPMLLDRKILKFCQRIFSYFIIISPLKKNVALHLNKLESPLPKDDLCLVEIDPVVLEKMKSVYSYEQTDDRRSEKAHLSFQFRWAKKRKKLLMSPNTSLACRNPLSHALSTLGGIGGGGGSSSSSISSGAGFYSRTIYILMPL